jgi:hypothetical protein
MDSSKTGLGALHGSRAYSLVCMTLHSMKALVAVVVVSVEMSFCW